MTAPKAAAPKFDPASVDTTVIDRYAKLVTGNQNLVSAPDIVGALASGNATTEQAQAIDQYMGAQRAAQRVRVAQQSGSKINLTGWDKLHLDQLGVSYAAVEYTDDLRTADTVKSLKDQGYVVDMNDDGSIKGALTQADAKKRDEAEKNRKTAKVGLTGGGGGFSIGDLNPITAFKDAGSNLLHGAQAAWNYVDYQMTNPAMPADRLVSKVNDRASGYTLEDQRDAAAVGYDPTSYWSMAAYAASGKGYNDTSDLIDSYGQDRIDQAKLFLNNPDDFVTKTIADNDAATGAQVLSDASAPEFQEMVRRVASRRAGIGNLVADNLGIDPIDNSKTYMGVSAVTELAAALLLDPSNAIFVGYKGVKAAQIGLTGGAADAAQITRVFDAANPSFKAIQVRRGAQSFLDETAIIANAAPDSLELAQAYARINARTPGLAPLIPDVLGVRRVATTGDVVGGNLPQIFNAAPIKTVEELGDYLASSAGMLRLTAGQSMIEGALIPGAIGRVGYRSIRASLASATTRASFRITERNAGRIIPSTANAVTHTGDNVFAAGDDAATALARADGAERGDALYAARKRSITQRAALAGARLVKFTPEDTKFVLGDPRSIEKARRYASLYLTKFDANNIAAQMARGDEGAQKAIINGLGMQTLHAAGAGNTTAGRKLIEQWSDFTAHRYGQIDDQLPDATGTLRPFGIHAADFTGTFSLPSFRDLRMGMAKVTVWSAVAGRVFENQTVDYLMSIVKAGWLLTGTNVSRNTMEPWANLALRGEVRDTLAAKAAARDAGGLDAIGRLKITTALSKLPALSQAGRAWRSLVQVGADPDELRYIAEFAEKNGGDILSSASKAHATSYLRQQDDVDILNQAGFGAARHTISGRSVAEVDAAREVSVGRAADQLARMAGDDVGFVRLVMKAVRDDGTHPGYAVSELAQYMTAKMPRVWAQARRSNVYKDADGKWVPAVTADEKLLARQSHAQAIVDDWKLSLMTKEGVVSEKLAKEIESTGKAPSQEWMVANLDDKTLPKNTLQDDFEAVLPDGKVSTFIGRIADLSGDAFATLVQRPIDRLTTAPMFYNGYGKARKAGATFEHRMIADGVSPETANNIMSKWAEQVAFQRVYARTDNPTLKTQLDVVGRNFFAFSRASQDFIRRWGSTFIEDPGRLRRASLAMDAAVSGGVVWDDPATGNRNFTFPLTGELMDKLTQVGTALHLPFVPEIPTATDVTGRVVFLQPGLNNPAQVSLTPIANLPMRQLMKLFPDSQQDLMQEIDLALNGEMGYGKSTLQQLAPSAIKRLMDANADDRDGMLGSATKEAFSALMASGRYDDYESWDDNRKQTFLDDLRTQTRNMLYMRAALGLFAPAPPSIDQTGFDESVDGVFELLGVRNLRDEAKVILDKAGGDKGKAMAIWSELHPDKLVYMVAGSESMTKGVYLPATEATNTWMTENLTWMKDNKNVSAYFIPADDTGDFSLLAWRGQIQLGLRQNKTLEEFAADAATVTSETIYYTEYNKYQADLTAAQVKGDKVYADQLKEMFTTWKSEFYDLHPLFRQKQGDYAGSVVNAQHQVESLRALAAGGSAPDSVKAELPGLQTMLAYYDDHKAFTDANPGQSKKAVADRNYDSANYAKWMAEIAGQSPALTAVYNGVFRYLDKDLERIGG